MLYAPEFPNNVPDISEIFYDPAENKTLVMNPKSCLSDPKKRNRRFIIPHKLANFRFAVDSLYLPASLLLLEYNLL